MREYNDVQFYIRSNQKTIYKASVKIGDTIVFDLETLLALEHKHKQEQRQAQLDEAMERAKNFIASATEMPMSQQLSCAYQGVVLPLFKNAFQFAQAKGSNNNE